MSPERNPKEKPKPKQEKAKQEANAPSASADKATTRARARAKKPSLFKSLFRPRIPSKGTLALALMFLLSVWPILLAATPLGSEEGSHYSIWNEGDTGLSALRLQLEKQVHPDGTPKYNISSDISSLNVLNRLNKTGVVAIIGPSSPFDITETISLILFLIRGGSLIIADDFGTGNEILDPIFSALENWGEFSKNLPGDMPSINDLIGASNEATEGGEASLLNLIGNVLKRIGFNNSALMDGESFTNSYAKPLITDFAESDLTEGISRLQLEFPTTISLKVNHTVTDEFGQQVLDENGNPLFKTDWMPLQKLSLDLVSDLIEKYGQGLAGAASSAGNVSIGLPFFPAYTTKNAWIETDFDREAVARAASGNPEDDFRPDPDEWSGARFSPIFYLPLIGGYIYFIGDPSIFINRWITQTAHNDNLRFALNLFEHATSRMENSSEPIMILFDEGHIYHGLRDPLLYTSNYLRIITSMSMFPLMAPLVPWVLGTTAYRMIPKPERLRPLLLTKTRRARGASDFEKRLKRIKAERAYDEALRLLYDRLIDIIRQRRGVKAVSPAEIAEVVVEALPQYKYRPTERMLKNIRAEIEKPTYKLKTEDFTNMLRFMKVLIDSMPRKA